MPNLPEPSMRWRGNLPSRPRAGSPPRRMLCGAAGKTPSRSSLTSSATYSATSAAPATTRKVSQPLAKSARRALRAAEVSERLTPGGGDELLAARAAVQLMYRTDRASQNLGLEILAVTPGSVRVSMTVRPEMVNGHGMCHGGIIFSLADSAFAFACNSHGDPMVAAGANIEFLKPMPSGE